ncbi:hypothetical protein ACQP2P_01700 [Dactylosporangium sp. CA-139114]|uniref:hypothetical protein n=1 Tax=Dactylosporangium sp. CA-139114 TaxID=3239931 RepID=UPI003D95990F
MPTAPNIPLSVRDEVLKLLYADADALDWERLPAQTKTAQYNQWVQDPRIGGLLGRFIPNPHLWIKEVPLKEYARALENMGRFAQFTSMHYPPPSDFIDPTFGGEWTYIPDSQADKPPHCLATDGTTQRYVCWGPPNQFKDLLWAALTAGVKEHGRPGIALSVRTDAEIEAADRRRNQAIGERCGIEVRYVIRPLRRRL